MDRDNTWHDVDDPLWINDNLRLQEVIVKVLHTAKVMQEAGRLLQLEGKMLIQWYQIQH